LIKFLSAPHLELSYHVPLVISKLTVIPFSGSRKSLKGGESLSPPPNPHTWWRQSTLSREPKASEAEEGSWSENSYGLARLNFVVAVVVMYDVIGPVELLAVVQRHYIRI
jgi:hypothetical protein